MSPTDRLLHHARRTGVIRSKDLERLRVPRSYLGRLVRRGTLSKRGRGLYVLAAAEPSDRRTLAEVARRVPHGVVCLLSALRVHDLTTQAPSEVWLAVDVKARAPKEEALPIRTVRMSGASRRAGVAHLQVEGVRVAVYDAAKTVADCFKFRNKIGLDVAIEALREFRRKRGSLDQLWRYARICRVARVMRPYVEALG
ncbi:MAG TPA: type IV toxin-antitoxin system AbiEi family antitoxin domain-containing protein [Anaeromyxobacter sp.]|nr:type IV toxin-antitoxin system AbiEi family antitoxin domain-containing protein [Anaeromyxobacter sp.]